MHALSLTKCFSLLLDVSRDWKSCWRALEEAILKLTLFQKFKTERGFLRQIGCKKNRMILQMINKRLRKFTLMESNKREHNKHPASKHTHTATRSIIWQDHTRSVVRFLHLNWGLPLPRTMIFKNTKILKKCNGQNHTLLLFFFSFWSFFFLFFLFTGTAEWENKQICKFTQIPL